MSLPSRIDRRCEPVKEHGGKEWTATDAVELRSSRGPEHGTGGVRGHLQSSGQSELVSGATVMENRSGGGARFTGDGEMINGVK